MQAAFPHMKRQGRGSGRNSSLAQQRSTRTCIPRSTTRRRRRRARSRNGGARVGAARHPRERHLPGGRHGGSTRPSSPWRPTTRRRSSNRTRWGAWANPKATSAASCLPRHRRRPLSHRQHALRRRRLAPERRAGSGLLTSEALLDGCQLPSCDRTAISARRVMRRSFARDAGGQRDRRRRCEATLQRLPARLASCNDLSVTKPAKIAAGIGVAALACGVVALVTSGSHAAAAVWTALARDARPTSSIVPCGSASGTDGLPARGADPPVPVAFRSRARSCGACDRRIARRRSLPACGRRPRVVRLARRARHMWSTPSRVLADRAVRAARLSRSAVLDGGYPARRCPAFLMLVAGSRATPRRRRSPRIATRDAGARQAIAAAPPRGPRARTRHVRRRARVDPKRAPGRRADAVRIAGSSRASRPISGGSHGSKAGSARSGGGARLTEDVAIPLATPNGG